MSYRSTASVYHLQNGGYNRGIPLADETPTAEDLRKACVDANEAQIHQDVSRVCYNAGVGVCWINELQLAK